MAYRIQLPPTGVAEQLLGGSPIADKVVTAATAATDGGTESFTVNRELGVAYRAYWSLPETEPLERFKAAYREIARLETQSTPDGAWRILHKAATAFHAESGVCPFCKELGQLHLPADQLAMELRNGE